MRRNIAQCNPGEHPRSVRPNSTGRGSAKSNERVSRSGIGTWICRRNGSVGGISRELESEAAMVRSRLWSLFECKSRERVTAVGSMDGVELNARDVKWRMLSRDTSNTPKSIFATNGTVYFKIRPLRSQGSQSLPVAVDESLYVSSERVG
jgi:hypothetical protein